MTAAAKSDEWQTPLDLFHRLDRRHGFTVDAASSHSNALLGRHWTVREDGLAQPWSRERVWCNPPYSRGQLGRWCGKALQEVAGRGCPLAVLLVPARTSEGWWGEWVLGRGSPELLGQLEMTTGLAGVRNGFALTFERLVVEVELLEGRLRFRETSGLHPKRLGSTARFASALVTYRGRR